MLHRIWKRSNIFFLGMIERSRSTSALKIPLPHGYKPNLDVIDECDAKHVSWFQQLLGIFQCAVELVRNDIKIRVVLMSQYQASLLLVHLEALYLIFHFLLKNAKKILIMDSCVQNVDEYIFNFNTYRKEFYGDLVEDGPH